MIVREANDIMALLKNKKIFIVEDNSQNRVVFQVVLLNQGARVEFNRSGRDVINQLKSISHLDAIVLDLSLGWGASGYEIYDEIRAVPQFDHIPIVAVSATDPVTGIAKTKSKGFNGFIAKPIDDVRFSSQLAKIIDGEAVWDAGGVSLDDELE